MGRCSPLETGERERHTNLAQAEHTLTSLAYENRVVSLDLISGAPASAVLQSTSTHYRPSARHFSPCSKKLIPTTLYPLQLCRAIKPCCPIGHATTLNRLGPVRRHLADPVGPAPAAAFWFFRAALMGRQLRFEAVALLHKLNFVDITQGPVDPCPVV